MTKLGSDSNIATLLQKQHADSSKLVREALKLLRALAGNDTVKINILKDGAAKQINDLINLHRVSHTLYISSSHSFHWFIIFSH